MFDDFDLFETCEEYYNDDEFNDVEDFNFFLTKEDKEELDRLFPVK